MSSSVWFEQVDNALIKLLKNTIHIDGKPVKVKVRKPDEDFSEEEYPLISIYCIGDRFSKIRYSPEPVVISSNKDKGFSILEDSALPYDLTYQIDFWATLQSDMNTMTKQWKAYSKSWFNLYVEDESATPRSCFVLCMSDFGKADLLKQGKRLFHSFGTYKIQVEIDDSVPVVVPIVKGNVDVKINDFSNQ